MTSRRSKGIAIEILVFMLLVGFGLGSGRLVGREVRPARPRTHQQTVNFLSPEPGTTFNFTAITFSVNVSPSVTVDPAQAVVEVNASIPVRLALTHATGTLWEATWTNATAYPFGPYHAEARVYNSAGTLLGSDSVEFRSWARVVTTVGEGAEVHLPDAVRASNGSYYAVWLSNKTLGTKNVWFARSDDAGENWTTPVNLTGYSAPDVVSNVIIAVDPTDRLYVAYTFVGGGTYQSFCLASSSYGKTWQQAQIQTGTDWASVTDMAIGTGNVIFVAIQTWDGIQGGTADLHVNLFNSSDGSSWNAIGVPLNPTQFGRTGNPVIAVHPATGALLLAYYYRDPDGAKTGVVYSSESDDNGTTWSSKSALVSGAYGQMDLKYDIEGRLHFVGADDTGVYHYFLREPGSFTWTRAETNSSITAFSRFFLSPEHKPVLVTTEEKQRVLLFPPPLNPLIEKSCPLTAYHNASIEFQFAHLQATVYADLQSVNLTITGQEASFRLPVDSSQGNYRATWENTSQYPDGAYFYNLTTQTLLGELVSTTGWVGLDRTAPQWNRALPGNEFTFNTSFQLNLTASDLTTIQYWIEINRGPWQAVTSNATLHADLFDEGLNEARFAASDALGATNVTGYVYLVKDTIAPRFLLNTPANFLVERGNHSITLNWTGLVPFDLHPWKYQVWRRAAGGSWTFRWETANLSQQVYEDLVLTPEQGTFEYKILLFDRAGHVGESVGKTVVFDFTNATDGSGDGTGTGTGTVTGDGTDPGRGLGVGGLILLVASLISASTVVAGWAFYKRGERRSRRSRAGKSMKPATGVQRDREFPPEVVEAVNARLASCTEVTEKLHLLARSPLPLALIQDAEVQEYLRMGFVPVPEEVLSRLLALDLPPEDLVVIATEAATMTRDELEAFFRDLAN